MAEEQKSIAILCAGGPAPGMNTVVGTVAKRFLADGFRVLGLNYGYKTLFTDDPDFIDFDYSLADWVTDKGGSYLKMSRHKPKDNEFKTDFFQKYNVKLLVTVGGDDTASTANRLTNYLEANSVQIQNIHVPKTIDNDLPLPEGIPTFGYQTAKNEGVRIATTVYEDARASDGWFVVSAMGREAGHLALGIGIASRYPMIVIPEMFENVAITFDRINKMMISSMVKRRIMGLDYGCIVISEGVFHFMSDEEILNSGIEFTFDAHGHPELGNVSKAHIFNILLQKELKKLNLKFRSRPVEIGYEVRCCPPTAFDLKYCTNLGSGVKVLFDKGEKGCIVVATNMGAIKPLYLKDISGDDGKVKPRLVDIHLEEFSMVFNNMEYIREADAEEAKKYLEHPEDYDLRKILEINI